MRKIELKKGWVIKNHEGKYLDENFWWIEVVKEKAYVHESNPNDIMLMLEKYRSDTCTVCQAMVFNGHLLLGKPTSRVCAKRSSWN